MTGSSLARIERLNYLIGAIAVLAAFFVSGERSVVLGVVVGVGLTCLNFAALRRIITRWTDDVAAGRPSNRSLLMLPKMMLLMGGVVVALWLLPISAPAFAIGYSIFVLSIVGETIYSMLAPAPATSPATEAGPATDENHHG
ncbi:MAG: ATP synthase subunit I [Kofleriaceae bacterium]|nr:ATP synthase subunit I [Kofleriaceae bacterium]MBP6836789.1 ATP synthase subunit I [Kofleriaceae bacterium]